MSTNDRRFEVVYPTSWDRLMRPSHEVADKDLLNPNVAYPKVPLMDGEFLQLNSEYKLVRATDLAAPAFAWMEWRGDMNVQGSGVGAIIKGGTYEADTIMYDIASLAVGSPLMIGTVTVDGLSHTGLVLHTASNWIVGYVQKMPASNGGRLRFLQTGV